MDPSVWTQVIRPALSDREGKACFIGTPKGRNAFCRLWEDAAGDPDWMRMMLKASETGLIREGAGRCAQGDERGEYVQEYECSFDAAVRGAYFAKELNQAEARGGSARCRTIRGFRSTPPGT